MSLFGYERPGVDSHFGHTHREARISAEIVAHETGALVVLFEQRGRTYPETRVVRGLVWTDAEGAHWTGGRHYDAMKLGHILGALQDWKETGGATYEPGTAAWEQLQGEAMAIYRGNP